MLGRWLARFVWWVVCKFQWPLTQPSHTIWRDNGPYMTRYYLFGRDGEGAALGWRGRVPWNVFLHAIVASDGYEYHSHPYRWSVSLILRGAYREARWRNGEVTKRILIPGDFNWISHDTFHRIEQPGYVPVTWTLFVSSRPQFVWWFWDPESSALRRASGKRKGGAS